MLAMIRSRQSDDPGGMTAVSTPLHNLVLEHLLADTELDPATINIIDAAYNSEAALEQRLTTLAHDDATSTLPTAAPPPRSDLEPSGVYLSSLEISAFRGIGPSRELEFTPGPGLTVFVGRNGSGKSSIAEGLETLLTGQSIRWADRTKEWQDGWRNLHVTHNPYLEARFAVEGTSGVVARRVWSETTTDVEQSELRLRRGEEKLTGGFDTLGWTDALHNFRPFLSSADLHALLNKPSELYDSLKGILGLEESATAVKRVTAARKARDERFKKAKDDCKRLLQLLEPLKDDPRAQRCREAMSKRQWRLDDVEAAVTGDHGGDSTALATLNALTQLTIPSVDAVADAVKAYRDSSRAVEALSGTSIEQNARLAGLLQQALHYCTPDTTRCPICGSNLPENWRQIAQANLAEANQLAANIKEATADLKRHETSLKALITPVPDSLQRVEHFDLPRDLLDTWQTWSVAPKDSAALCSHIETHFFDLHAAHSDLIQLAQQKRDQLQTTWRPIAADLAAWLQLARSVQAENHIRESLSKALEWLKDMDATLRDKRFEPIANHAQSVWTQLRQQSSVDLANIKLQGTGTKRRVELNVSVDGRDGVALSVMSQGELNALALSLFLPRMLLTESPFRFLIIDDPVQAFDNHKVDGLVQVLAEVAKTRQVIVLSHDPRLFAAIQRLQVTATVYSVERRAGSILELRRMIDPVQRYLYDANTIARDAHAIGPKLTPRAVPAFCRLAVEAACVEAIRKRRYARGDDHAGIEQTIQDARTLHQLVTLALFDDPNRGGEVFTHVDHNLGRIGGDTYRVLKAGTHHGFNGSLDELIKNTGALTRYVRGRGSKL